MPAKTLSNHQKCCTKSSKMSGFNVLCLLRDSTNELVRLQHWNHDVKNIDVLSDKMSDFERVGFREMRVRICVLALSVCDGARVDTSVAHLTFGDGVQMISDSNVRTVILEAKFLNERRRGITEPESGFSNALALCYQAA